MLPLNAGNLSSLPADLAVPAYDRAALRTGIVHFGVGGFHRAHEAMYLDRLMTEGKALDWAICGVGVMPADRRMQRGAGRARTACTRWSSRRRTARLDARVIGSIKRVPVRPRRPRGGHREDGRRRRCGSSR